jgi:hypothetical protein
MTMYRVIVACILATLVLAAHAASDLRIDRALPYCPGVLKIDGLADDWQGVDPIIINALPNGDPRQVIYVGHPEQPFQGNADLSGRVRVAWDASALYVLAEITDDHLVGARPGSAGNQGPAPWGCDSVLITLNSYRRPMQSNSPTSADPCLGLRYMPQPGGRGSVVALTDAQLSRIGNYMMQTPGSRVAIVEAPDGYCLEAAVPWSDLGYVPAPGERIFMGFLLADIDPNEADLNQAGWGWSSTINGYPVFELADPRGLAVGTVTLSADQLPVGKSWSARIDVAATAQRVSGDRILVQDTNGKTMYSQRLDVTAEPGERVSVRCEVSESAVKQPGQYRVVAQVKEGGKRRPLASETLNVHTEDAASVTMPSTPGELRHYRPGRVTHHAAADVRRGVYRYGFVTGKEDYTPFIHEWILPELKDETRRAIAAHGTYGFTQLLPVLMAYRLTGDAEYAKLGSALITTLLDNRHLEAHGLLSITAYRYLTWKQDPATPFAPADAEAKYRAAFHEIAAKPASVLFREQGTHNRVWHAYCMLKIARLIAEEDGTPIDPRVRTFTDLHDTLLWNTRDDDDASSGYHWVWLPFMLSIAFHTGDLQEMADHPGVQAVFTRYSGVVSPSGGCPTFGSDGGWPQPGKAMWMYEWYAAMTRNGKYRWISHRIAEYYYNHLTSKMVAKQYHNPFDQARENFALAYLFADDAVKPMPPSGNSYATWRYATEPTPPAFIAQHPGMAPMRMNTAVQVPDKLVLCSGTQAQGLWALIDLLAIGGHAGETPGNICALLDQDALLVGGQGYYELTPQFQNTACVEDLEGIPANPEPAKVSVSSLVDDPAVTVARIEAAGYQRLPVDLTRDIIFWKSGFMVVKDRLTFHAALKVRAGTNIHTRDLGPECGDHWFNAYYDDLYWTGLGLGYGVQEFRNPARDLLVYFTPRKEYAVNVRDTYLENRYQLSPLRLRQSWTGMTRPGMTMTFVTVLLPHRPTFTPSALVQPSDGSQPWVSVQRDDDAVTALTIRYEANQSSTAMHEVRLILNDGADAVTVDGFEGDGLLQALMRDAQGHVTNAVQIGGSVLRWQGQEAKGVRRHQRTPLTLPKAGK